MPISRMFDGSRTSKNWMHPVSLPVPRDSDELTQFGMSEKKSLANARILPFVGTSSFSHDAFGMIPVLAGVSGVEMS